MADVEAKLHEMSLMEGAAGLNWTKLLAIVKFILELLNHLPPLPVEQTFGKDMDCDDHAQCCQETLRLILESAYNCAKHVHACHVGKE